jgi:hypothetical protein
VGAQKTGSDIRYLIYDRKRPKHPKFPNPFGYRDVGYRMSEIQKERFPDHSQKTLLRLIVNDRLLLPGAATADNQAYSGKTFNITAQSIGQLLNDHGVWLNHHL